MSLIVSVIGLLALGPMIVCGEDTNPVEVDASVTILIDSLMVPAQEAGPLVELATREGRRVLPGELLVRIDDQDAILEANRAQLALEHAIEQAENDIKQRLANQDLKVAELELRNAEDANKELARVVSDSQIQKLRIAVENAKLQIEQVDKDRATAKRAVAVAQNDTQLALRNVARRRLVAPSPGLVVEIRRQIGEWVQPGEAVVRIVRDDRLRVEGFVSASRLKSSMIGREVEVTYEPAGEPPIRIHGEVTFVSPEANPINGQVRLWAEIDNRDGRLRAGLPVRMVVNSSEPAKPTETPANAPRP